MFIMDCAYGCQYLFVFSRSLGGGVQWIRDAQLGRTDGNLDQGL
jgi:hypothetical protein